MAEIRTYATPSFLYRYRPLSTDEVLERELRAIREGYVFCPTSSELNDPMEGSHRESALLQASPNAAETIEQVLAQKEQLGIASFSETYKHEPMWAHYAGNFAGMCISYTFSKLRRGLPEDHDFVRMMYSDKPPILLKSKATIAEKARLVLSAKTIRWSSEREWRLICPSRGQASYGRAKCVQRVYLGARLKDDFRQKVIATLRPLKIAIFLMEIDQYELSFKKLEDG